MCCTLMEGLDEVKHLRNKTRLHGFLDLIADLLINWDFFCCRAILFHSIHSVKDVFSIIHYLFASHFQTSAFLEKVILRS